MSYDKRVERFENDKSKEWSLPPVQRIERDKKSEKDLPPGEKKERADQALLFAALAVYAKKFLNLFSSKENLQAALVDRKQILEDLRSFKKLLEQLIREDLSRVSLFTRQFSDLWYRLIEDLKRIEEYEKGKPVLGSELKRMLETVGNFPPASDHPLGYYLTKHVGEEWLPFPFMDILSLLHKEHIQNQKRSVLSAWLALIQNVQTAIENNPNQL